MNLKKMLSLGILAFSFLPALAHGNYATVRAAFENAQSPLQLVNGVLPGVCFDESAPEVKIPTALVMFNLAQRKLMNVVPVTNLEFSNLVKKNNDLTKTLSAVRQRAIPIFQQLQVQLDLNPSVTALTIFPPQGKTHIVRFLGVEQYVARPQAATSHYPLILIESMNVKTKFVERSACQFGQFNQLL